MGVICQPFFVANHATELITVSSQVHCKNNLFTPPVLGLLPLPASFLTLAGNLYRSTLDFDSSYAIQHDCNNS